jgi:hypothetical protein
MDQRSILLCRFAKGLVGEDTVDALASLLTSEILFAALSRASIPEAERVPFYLFIDEFHTCTRGNAYSYLFTELRKYGVYVDVLDQTCGASEELARTILGQVGTLIAYKVGPHDAKILAEAIPLDEQNTLVRMNKHWAYVKTERNGITTDPLLVHAFPPMERPARTSTPEAIISRTEKNYCRWRPDISRKINTTLAA